MAPDPAVPQSDPMSVQQGRAPVRGGATVMAIGVEVRKGGGCGRRDGSDSGCGRVSLALSEPGHGGLEMAQSQGSPVSGQPGLQQGGWCFCCPPQRRF